MWNALSSRSLTARSSCSLKRVQLQQRAIKEVRLQQLSEGRKLHHKVHFLDLADDYGCSDELLSKPEPFKVVFVCDS